MPSWGVAQNPWYSSSNPYGWSEGTSFPTTPVGQQYVQTEPGVAFTRATSGFAGGLNPYSRFVQGQENRVNDAYLAAVANNPNLTRQDFLANYGPDFWARLWQSLGPRGQGQNRGQFAPGQRWNRWG